MSKANLFNADLTGAKLRRANLTGSIRMGCTVKRSALKGAYIAGKTAYIEDEA